MTFKEKFFRELDRAANWKPEDVKAVFDRLTPKPEKKKKKEKNPDASTHTRPTKTDAP